jgi:hypothetical protein
MFDRIRRRQIALVLAVVLPLLISLVLVPVRRTFPSTSSALILVVVIVAAAAYGERESGIAASISSSIWFDFFLTRPYENFSIIGRGDIETAVLLFVIGVAVSEIAVRARRQTSVARERAAWLAMLHDFAEMVATGESPEFVVIRAAAELSGLLSLQDCRFEATAPDSRVPRLEPGGDIYVQSVKWDTRELGLPGREVELLVESHGQSRGKFILVPAPGRPITLDRLIVAVALADQVGAALSGQARRD